MFPIIVLCFLLKCQVKCISVTYQGFNAGSEFEKIFGNLILGHSQPGLS